MKKYLILVALIFAFTVTVYAAPPEVPIETTEEYNIKAKLPVDDLLVGDEVYIDISVDTDETVRGFEIALEYDADILEYKEVEYKNSELENDEIVIEKTTEGELLFALASVGEDVLDTSKKLCTVVFSAEDDGDTEVILQTAKVVLDDMTYFADYKKEVELTIERKKPKKSGGGGGGGGGFSVRTPVKVVEPEVVEPEKTEPTEIEVQENNEPQFTDVSKNHWAYESIVSLAKHGIINGYEDGSFLPEETITRAEFVTMIVNMTDGKADAESVFIDVNEADWFYNAVSVASKIGLVKGNEYGYFNPNGCITRQDAATVLSRYISLSGYDKADIREQGEFADSKDIADYAKEHIKSLYVKGIVSGRGDNMFYPESNITRAEAATMLYGIIR